jgi:hypothetical protein
MHATHYHAGQGKRMNLIALLARTARRWPAAGAVFLGTQQRWTWAELHARALALAGALGHAPGRIAIATENCPQYLELLFGAWAAEGAVVPLNYKLHPREMAQIAEDAQPSVIFVSPALEGGLREALPPDWPGKVIAIGSAEYEALFDAPPATPRTTHPQALAWLFYTSGTTGRSKGAMLSHRNLMAMTLAHLADVESIDEHCSQVHAAPMSHGSGLYIPAYVARGARQVIPPSQGFEPDEFLGLCDAHPGCGAFLAAARRPSERRPGHPRFGRRRTHGCRGARRGRDWPRSAAGRDGRDRRARRRRDERLLAQSERHGGCVARWWRKSCSRTPASRKHASWASATRSGAKWWSHSSSLRRALRSPRATSMHIASSASLASSDRSATSSRTRCPRTATARCSSANCARCLSHHNLNENGSNILAACGDSCCWSWPS